MTREEIEKLEAGRKLDILIAEKVMGFEQSDLYLRTRPRKDIPFFSSNISAAWKYEKVE